MRLIASFGRLDLPLQVLKFFFDPGSGICLWAGNAAARERWDYAVDAHLLPIAEDTGRLAAELCSWFDTSIDWASPSGPSPWAAAERERFNVESQRFLRLLRSQLGPEFEVIDASGTAGAA